MLHSSVIISGRWPGFHPTSKDWEQLPLFYRFCNIVIHPCRQACLSRPLDGMGSHGYDRQLSIGGIPPWSDGWASYPLIIGISKSIITASYSSERTASTASRPLLAVWTTKDAPSRISLATCWLIRLSSTKSTRTPLRSAAHGTSSAAEDHEFQSLFR